jgi:hypothetical protein
MYDPLLRHRMIEKLVVRGEEKKYHRFRCVGGTAALLPQTVSVAVYIVGSAGHPTWCLQDLGKLASFIPHPK